MKFIAIEYLIPQRRFSMLSSLSILEVYFLVLVTTGDLSQEDLCLKNNKSPYPKGVGLCESPLIKTREVGEMP